jgi:hypothetical protein
VTEIKSKIREITNVIHVRISHTDLLVGTSLEIQKKIKTYSELHNFKLDEVYYKMYSSSLDF